MSTNISILTAHIDILTVGKCKREVPRGVRNSKVRKQNEFRRYGKNVGKYYPVSQLTIQQLESIMWNIRATQKTNYRTRLFNHAY